jgi:hypothetical protein
MSSRSLLTQERRSPFRLYINHTWGLRGASRGRDKLPLVYFAAIVPVIHQIPYLDTPCYGDKTGLPRVSRYRQCPINPAQDIQ